jgi:hypothetical protein
MRILEYNELMSILPVTPKPGEGGSTPRSRTLSESAINNLRSCFKKHFIE